MRPVPEKQSRLEIREKMGEIFNFEALAGLIESLDQVLRFG
jgi:hypothetical protein